MTKVQFNLLDGYEKQIEKKKLLLGGQNYAK